jgi:hypothetical protein
MSCITDDPATGTMKAYSRPKLSVYGDVKGLTASGSAGGKEGGTTPICDGNTAKRPC